MSGLPPWREQILLDQLAKGRELIGVMPNLFRIMNDLGLDVLLPQIWVGFAQMTEHILGDWTYAEWYRSGPVLGLFLLCVAGLVQHGVRFKWRDSRDLPAFLCLTAMMVSASYFMLRGWYFMYDAFYVFLLMPAALALACLLRDVRLHLAPVVLYVILFV